MNAHGNGVNKLIFSCDGRECSYLARILNLNLMSPSTDTVIIRDLLVGVIFELNQEFHKFPHRSPHVDSILCVRGILEFAFSLDPRWKPHGLPSLCEYS